MILDVPSARMTDFATPELEPTLEEVERQRAITMVDRLATDDVDFHTIMAMLGLSDFEGAVARPA